jgi:predicted dithiol-disulfide oxidoreductase (DUF899 family)
MPEQAVGTREQWLSARKELLDAEKAHMRRGEELARRRRELPWVPIEREYTFETDEGRKTLADLFDGRSQLLVYHFMFDFGFRVDEQNPGCTGLSGCRHTRHGWAGHFPGSRPSAATSGTTSARRSPRNSSAAAPTTTSSTSTGWRRSARG